MIGILAVIVALALAAYAYRRRLKQELDEIVSDLSGTVSRLETFVANKQVEVADHLEEIALANHHVNVKQADIDRATRIRNKLNELLA